MRGGFTTFLFLSTVLAIGLFSIAPANPLWPGFFELTDRPCDLGIPSAGSQWESLIRDDGADSAEVLVIDQALYADEDMNGLDPGTVACAPTPGCAVDGAAGHGDTITVHTRCRQALHGAAARYVVTTTRSRGRPLTPARIEVHLPEGYVPLEFSHRFVEEPGDRGRSFVFGAAGFRPETDILVGWSQGERSRDVHDDASP